MILGSIRIHPGQLDYAVLEVHARPYSMLEPKVIFPSTEIYINGEKTKVKDLLIFALEHPDISVEVVENSEHYLKTVRFSNA